MTFSLFNLMSTYLYDVPVVQYDAKLVMHTCPHDVCLRVICLATCTYDVWLPVQHDISLLYDICQPV
jgi:hypothetical protein